MSRLQRTFLVPPSFVEAFEVGSGQIVVNLHILNDPLPYELAIQNEVIPNEVFDLRFMSLLLVEHPIISLNPNSQKSNAPAKVPNLHFLDKLLWSPAPKKGLFPMETIILTSTIPCKVHA